MLILRSPDTRSSEITPKATYLNRRSFLAAASGASLLQAQTFPTPEKSPLSTTEKRSPRKKQTAYNNFYEFGTGKRSRRRTLASSNLALEGRGGRASSQAQDMTLTSFMKARASRRADLPAPLRRGVVDGGSVDRVSRCRRCHEGRGADVEGQVCRVQTLLRSKQMPPARWPAFSSRTSRALRMDEAMHPLAILAVGMYGETAAEQNGAPCGWSCRGSTDSRASSRS